MTFATAAEEPSVTRAQDFRRAVLEGLSQRPRRLPPWLFYDEEGSRLFEAITELPEYYLTRTERAIFESHGEALMTLAAAGRHATVIELGAGTAAKTQILVRELAKQQRTTLFLPVDVSATALEVARARFNRATSQVCVRPWVATHEQAFARLRTISGRKIVLFVGSSLGNYEHAEARVWLTNLRLSLNAGDALVLGTDLKKAPQVLLPAYDDRAGVTAAFNRNVLARINRELGGHFVLERFRHVALWNASDSCVEMHLESDRDQVVNVDALDLRLRLNRGERIHTESSVKYDDQSLNELLARSGFSREHTFMDADGWFGVHLARVPRAEQLVPGMAHRHPR